MACFHPRYGYRGLRGLIHLDPPACGGWRGKLTLSCGQCVGCRAERSRQWGVRGMHELQLHESGSYLTLTYADENLPENSNLVRRDWQLFAKRLRAKRGPFRFLMCGEYGSDRFTHRPHYHAVLFGLDFPDQVFEKKNDKGDKLFTSSELAKIWSHGTHVIGNVSFDSIVYVAGYTQKKMNGDKAKAYYTRVNISTGEIFDQVPEFALMSRNPGLGKKWIEKYHSEVYPRDAVLVNGKFASPPDYYDRWYEANFPAEMAAIKIKRTAKGKEYEDDNSPERLATKKKVFTQKYGNYKRRS